MARKRKLDQKSAEASGPPQKQHQKEERLQDEQEQGLEDRENQENQENQEDVEYVEVEEEQEVDEDDEEQEVDDDDEGEDGGGDNRNAAGDQTVAENGDGGEDNDEPIQDLLEPFGKEQLLNLLTEAAKDHRDVADRIRKIANDDPVHRKIFVHGLGWDTKTEALVEAFKQYGEIEDCRVVTDKLSGKSKGYGFILFKMRSGARNALKQPQKKIGNRMAACQLASVGPVANPPAAKPVAAVVGQQSSSDYTQRKIYVSNVGSELDPHKLQAFFSRYGEIEEGPLGIDKMTGKPKGFCLFVYKSVESARKALEEPHKNFEGHVLHCQKAIDGPKPNKQHQQRNTNHNPRYQRNDNSGYNAVGGPGQMMAPTQVGMSGPPGQPLNPALGHALSAFLATQGAGLGLNPALGQVLLGTLGSATAVNPAAAGGMPTAYGSQPNITPGVMGGYALQNAYPSQPPGQSGAGRGQHGMGQYGGSYMGH